MKVRRKREFMTPNVPDQRRCEVGAPLADRNLWEPLAVLASGVTKRDDRCIALLGLAFGRDFHMCSSMVTAISSAFEEAGLLLRRAYLEFARPARSRKLGRGARLTS